MKLPVQSVSVSRNVFLKPVAVNINHNVRIQIAQATTGSLTSNPSRAAISRTSVLKKAAESFPFVCPFLPAEFGCGCYLDGIQTPCRIVAWCLDVGFCEPA